MPLKSALCVSARRCRLILRSIIIAALASICGAAMAADPPAERLLHEYLSIALSPDGTRVASVEGDATASGGIPQIRDLVIRRVANGKNSIVNLPCGRVPECWPDSPVWIPDGSRIAFTLRKPGSHSRSIYTVSAEGTELTKLIDFNGTIVHLKYATNARLAMLAIEGATKEVGATQAGAPITADLSSAAREQRIAILEGESLHWISPPDLFVYEYDWQPDGSGFVGTASPGDGDSNWWIAKLYTFLIADSNAKLLYVPANPQQQLANPRVAPDGKHVVFIGGLMSDFGATGGDVYSLPINGGAPTNLTDGMHASATSLGWNCNGQLLVRSLAGADYKILEMGSGSEFVKPRELWSATESLNGGDAGFSIGCGAQLTATVHESFTMPPEIHVGPIGAWQQLTHANDGMSVPARVQSITWKNDGFDLQGWMFLPANASGRLPMMTHVHGGPASAATPRFIGPGLSLTLLKRGYAIFYPNPRGSFGQGERFTLANVRDFGYGDLRDILAGVDAASRAASIDQERLAISGGSYGGYMTMWAVTQTHRFKAAVAGAGISNWQSYYGQNGIDAWMIPYFDHSVYDDPEIYARSSPIVFIKNVKTPTFVYAGERDIECPPAQTREFWHALKTLGVPTDMAIYPDEGHGLRDPANVADLERRTLAWLDQYLNLPAHSIPR